MNKVQQYHEKAIELARSLLQSSPDAGRRDIQLIVIQHHQLELIRLERKEDGTGN